MKRRNISVLLILIICHCNSLFAKNETIRIEDYSYEEGLTSSGVNSVFKDSKGFLWICTTNGLFRYDGYSFKNINSIASEILKYETYCIVEDKNQNFWIGTAGKGIIYYNSHTGKLFSLKLSEGSNSKVNRILFFSNRVWVATNEGLLVIDEKEDIDANTLFKVKVLWPDPLQKHLQMNVINFIYVQPGGKSLWIGTNSPLYELDPDTYEFKIVNSYNQNSIRWLADYSNGKILASSWDGGVFIVNPSKHILENDSFINEINRIVGDKRVKSALVDRQDRYWIATFGDGLYIFDKDKNGNLRYENYRNEEKLPIKLKSNFIDQIFIDSTGTAWLSMAESGLSKIYFRNDYFHYYNFFESNNSKSKEIHAIKQSSDRNKFWISFNRNELDLFDSENYSYRQFTSRSSDLQLQNDKINFTYQDKKGNLWIIYSRIGIYVVPSKFALSLIEGKSKGTIKPLEANLLFSSDPRENSYITNCFDDSKGRLWIECWDKAFVLEILDGFLNSKSSGQLVANSKIENIYSEANKDQVNFTISPVSSMVEVGENVYWLGTRNEGIIEIEELSNHKFVGRELDINDKLPSNFINCIYMDKNRNLWIGTNSGLCYLKNNKLQILNLKNGLCSESINNITEDANHDIWISTSYGISKINSKDLSIRNFYNPYNSKLNQFITGAVTVSTDGNIWFSTNESLVTFNTGLIENFQISTPVYFTDIKINNHTIIPSEKYRGIRVIDNEVNLSNFINVPYGSTLNIEFAVLDYLDPGKIMYKYKLGNKSEWIILSHGQRSLNLLNTNPGEYNLSIMVVNSSGKRGIKSVKIHFLPPFWLSKMAYSIYLLIVLVLLFTYRKLVIQKTLQKSLVEKERYERKKIEELDKMKSEFFSNISHEFRTPLSLIINPLEKLINEDHLSIKDKNSLKLVLKSSNRLLKLTNELMDFSKIEKELLKPDFQLCEIVSMTDEISNLFNNIADLMSIELKVNYPFDHLELPIDRGMVEKMIFNLLSNAFKYTSINGMVMINLSKSSEAETEYVKISVINTGEGISQENLSKVFDRYFQINNVQNKNVAGTGIGLALVKSFVELHNGKVEVKSEPNLETCFDIYLPTTQSDFKYNSESSATLHKKLVKNIKIIDDNENLSNKHNYAHRILIVEDEEDIRNYIIEELSQEYKIIFAKNGEEGLNMANETIPDLIITDVMMPVLSGIELCKKLKNQVITSHIPIIILSAKTEIRQQIEGLEMGADVYMIKPFNIDVLKVQVQRLITFKQAIYSKYLKETTLIPQDSGTSKLDDEFIRKALTFIEENMTDSNLNVDQLANCVSLSKVQTYRKVKAISGLSIVEFIRTVRLKKASQLILEDHLNFSEIAFITGFSTPSYFSKCFHDHFGKTPSEFAAEYGKEPAVS
jgi:signal transduction histidine kinase/ligand-binding sensor domain-containing protein/DNA-binding response OmpR family regulator